MKNRKHKQKGLLWNARMDSERHIFALPHRLVRITYKKRKEFNLESHFAFCDYVKIFDKVKREKLFEILQNKNILNSLLKLNGNLFWRENKVKQSIIRRT